MTRYIILDNYSGYIWGEATASDPVEACRIMDAEHGVHDRDYTALRHDPKDTGYHVYEASEGSPAFIAGWDESELRHVQDQCRWVGYVRSEQGGVADPMKLIPITTEAVRTRRGKAIQAIDEQLGSSPLTAWRKRDDELFADAALLSGCTLLPPELVVWPDDDRMHNALIRVHFSDPDADTKPCYRERREWSDWAAADLINWVIEVRRTSRSAGDDWWPSSHQIERHAMRKTIYVWRHVFAELVDESPNSTAAYVQWYSAIALVVREALEAHDAA